MRGIEVGVDVRLNGFRVVREGVVASIELALACREPEARRKGERGVLLIDEVSSVTTVTVGLAFRVVDQGMENGMPGFFVGLFGSGATVFAEMKIECEEVRK